MPAALLGLCVLGYGLLIPGLGFYWDDWGLVWFYRTLGVGGLHGIWAVDRPLMDLLFRITAPILGDLPWKWQVFGLLTRWLSAVSVWWSFRQVWPGRRREAAWLAMLFAVYPGFQQQSISVVYSHYFLVLTLGVLSLGLMAAAARDLRRRWGLWILSIALGGWSMFSLEFFLGLEVLRPLILWRMTPARGGGERLRLRHLWIPWLPYLLLLAGFLVWRVAAVGFRGYEPALLDAAGESPGQAVESLAATIPGDILESGLVAWGSAFVPPDLAGFGLRASLASFTVSALTAGGVFLFLRRLDTPRADRNGRPLWRSLIGWGLILLLAAGWPFWIAGLPLRLQFPWDRFTLGMMLGSCLLVLGLAEGILRSFPARALAVSLLIGAAVGVQLRAGITFRRSWEDQRSFLWNLTWRVPGLDQGTLLLANEIPIDYMTDNSWAAVINWMYAPGWASPQMPYMIYDIDKRLGRGLRALEEGLEVTQGYSATSFRGSTSKALVIYYSSPGCLRVVDQVLDDSSPVIGRETAAAIHLSRLDLIDLSASPPAALPLYLQGPDPVHGWCYYFEQADLARQRGDWERIVGLGEEAFSLADHPNQADERIPFIEAYAHVGQWERAQQLTLDALGQNPSTDRILCHAWERLSATIEPDDEARAAIGQTRLDLGCGF
jgi:hypothetical protein